MGLKGFLYRKVKEKKFNKGLKSSDESDVKRNSTSSNTQKTYPTEIINEEMDSEQSEIKMEDALETKREIGYVLENHIEHIFRTAGFDTERNLRIAKYEIDVLVKLGDRRIIIECKNYQRSDLVIRNIIHQWNSKNQIIKADKIIIVIYGIPIKVNDRKLAENFGIELWGKNEVEELSLLLMNPTELKKRLLSKISLKPISISELYRTELEKLVFYPLLTDTEEDVEENMHFMLNAVKKFIRTELRIAGTTKDEREKHIRIFETEIKEKYSYMDTWNGIRDNLRKKEILPLETRKKYIGYVDGLRNELENVKEWFKGTDEKVIRRLIKARICDSLNSENNICRFGFDESQVVEVEPRMIEDNLIFLLKLQNLGEEEINIVSWILTREHIEYREETVEGMKPVERDFFVWIFNTLEDVVEGVYRILDEFYKYEKGSKLLDYAITPKRKMCFIATAAYGTPFAKEIDVLRKWRDTTLMNNFIGKTFVKFYYTISPSIANVISKSEILKKTIRTILNPFVKHLKRISNPHSRR